MITVNKGTKAHKYLMYDWKHAHGGIYDRYVKPSQYKVSSFEDIIRLYNCYYDELNYLAYFEPKTKKMYTLVYEKGTIKIAGASSHFYSTVALFRDLQSGKHFIVKETHVNTYIGELTI